MGLDLKPYADGEKNPSGLLGRTYREKGFCFFSAYLEDIPKNYRRDISIYCDIPKGFKAIYTDELKKRRGLGGLIDIAEVVTQRGLTWRILKAWRDREGGLCLKVMPLRGSDTPEALARDIADMA